MHIVAFEGGVCAGKSTVAVALADQLNAFVLADYANFIDEFEYTFAARLPTVYRLRFFLRLDEARSTRLPPGRHQVLADRSIFTLLAYEYILMKLGLVPNLNYVLEELPKFAPLIPNSIIFLDVSNETRRRRADKRKNSVAQFLLEENFDVHLRAFFKKVCSRWEYPSIDTTHNNLSVVCEFCREAIDQDIEPPSLFDISEFVQKLQADEQNAAI